MTVPRLVRVLGILSFVLFLYLVLQIFKSPPHIRGPGEKLLEMTKDPNLERMEPKSDFYGSLLILL